MPLKPLDIPVKVHKKIGVPIKNPFLWDQVAMLCQADMTAEQIVAFMQLQGKVITVDTFHARLKERFSLNFSEFKKAQLSQVGTKLYTKTIGYLFSQLDAATKDPTIKVNTGLLLQALKRFCGWDISNVSFNEATLTVNSGMPQVNFVVQKAEVIAETGPGAREPEGAILDITPDPEPQAGA